MQPKESRYPKDWLATGEKDFKRTELLFSADDYEGAGFHLQQAIEKYLKGYLLSKGWKLKRIHDLEALLNAVLEYDGTFENFRSLCVKATNYYIEERYPLLVLSKINRQDLDGLLKQGRELIKLIKERTSLGD